jgi:L-ascorbate metabolism protein UlaG (beta-lactamase superfamily)
MDVFVTHISTACVLLEIGSVRILTDPVFDEGKRYYRFRWPGIGATRLQGPAVEADRIPDLDAILLSHAHHSDNLDDGGRSLFGRARQIITTIHDKKYLRADAIGLSKWGSTTIHGQAGEIITVSATPALHGPYLLCESWHVCGFVLEWAGQERGALYISGDTVYFNGLREISERFKIGTALLHLGAVHFWPPWPRCFRFTFDSADAVRIANLLGLERLIPIHYEQDVWSHFKEDLASYQSAFQDAGLQHKVTWLAKGVRTGLSI